MDDPIIEIISEEELSEMSPLVREIRLLRNHWIEEGVRLMGILNLDQTGDTKATRRELWYADSIVYICDRQLMEIFPRDVLCGGY